MTNIINRPEAFSRQKDSANKVSKEGVVFHFLSQEPRPQLATVHQLPQRSDAATIPPHDTPPATVTSLDSRTRSAIVAIDVPEAYTSKQSELELIKGVIAGTIAASQRRGQTVISTPDNKSADALVYFAGDPDGLDFT
jgi:hypothetical protein